MTTVATSPAPAVPTVYLDYAATTPVDPRVAALMCECLQSQELCGNPSSTGHAFGRRARALVETARRKVALLVNARPETVVWTSGATESNNLALLGAARFNASRGKHIVSARTEHKAVLDPLKRLEREGFSVTYLTPDRSGIVRPEQVIDVLRPDTLLVSLMHVNNETGVVQDIGAVGAACRERGRLFHVDAAQSAGKVPIDVEALGVDLMSLTAHKVYGPKGVGALYLRRRPPLGLTPLIEGGGQEGGLRSGTLATHQIAGMGLAFELAAREGAADSARVAALRDRLWQGISSIGGVRLNGHPHQRIAGVLNVAFGDVEGESLQFALRDLAVSAGAACSSESEEPSYVLRALGLGDAEARSSLRFSLGRFSTEADVDFAIDCVRREVPRLRGLAPGAPAQAS